MNSSAIKRTISLARLFNRWVFPSITAMTLVFILLSSSGTYYALKPLIPSDHGLAILHVLRIGVEERRIVLIQIPEVANHRINQR